MAGGRLRLDVYGAALAPAPVAAVRPVRTSRLLEVTWSWARFPPTSAGFDFHRDLLALLLRLCCATGEAVQFRGFAGMIWFGRHGPASLGFNSPLARVDGVLFSARTGLALVVLGDRQDGAS